jgi:hypothetical protein
MVGYVPSGYVAEVEAIRQDDEGQNVGPLAAHSQQIPPKAIPAYVAHHQANQEGELDRAPRIQNQGEELRGRIEHILRIAVQYASAAQVYRIARNGNAEVMELPIAFQQFTEEKSVVMPYFGVGPANQNKEAKEKKSEGNSSNPMDR